MDIPLILMYSFFAILNVKIYLSIGITTYIRKLFKENALKTLSQLLVNTFLPIYGVIEVARMATPSNMQVFWIMIISVITSMIIGYYSGKLSQYLFKLDVRIENSYNLLCSLPSIGTLPLVLAKAFCYPGGPLNDDPQCANILGYMMINYLVLQITLFLIGFHMIAKDANFGYIFDEKMSLTWHIICEKLFKKDYWVLYMFRKYFKEKKLAYEKFNEFEKDNKLIKNEGDITYSYVKKEIDNFNLEGKEFLKQNDEEFRKIEN